jgi:hypothetical protein
MPYDTASWLTVGVLASQKQSEQAPYGLTYGDHAANTCAPYG